jgi:glutamyl-Q tRNA(Asp) synthetase
MPAFRFAPSPNGRLHLGHAYSALLNAKLALELEGRFLVRLEDIDTTRCTPQLARFCLEDLAWLGLEWEQPVRIQSEHFKDYAKALDKLKKKGLLYPCACTRREVAEAAEAQDPDGAPIYPGTCRGKSFKEITEPHALRLDMAKALKTARGPYIYKRFLDGRTVQANPARWGDAVLARKDIGTSYHLSVVVDDALQNITHVVRGADLEAATDLHVLLQKLLNLSVPQYHHHALLQEESGEKLGKSRGSETIADLRARGLDATEVRRMAGF